MSEPGNGKLGPSYQEVANEGKHFYETILRWVGTWPLAKHASLLSKIQILIYAYIIFVFARYILTLGLQIHGFWSWYVWKSLLYIAAAAYMIRWNVLFLRSKTSSVSSLT